MLKKKAKVRINLKVQSIVFGLKLTRCESLTVTKQSRTSALPITQVAIATVEVALLHSSTAGSYRTVNYITSESWIAAVLSDGTVLHSCCIILSKKLKSGCLWRARIEVRFTLDHGGATVTGGFRIWIICACVTLKAVNEWEIGKETTYKPEALKDKDTRTQNENIS